MGTARARSIANGREKRDARRLPRPKGGLREFSEALQGSGRYAFSRAEATRALRITPIALKHAAWRLSKAGRVVAPRRGFYVIVPPEYRAAGSLPPSWFIGDLMAHLRRPYYVGLLSAAGLHGASHQSAQEFQVVTDIPLRPIRMGRTRIRFVKKAHLARTPTVDVKTPTGTMRVSTPEATALDLVRYPEHAGFLPNIVTVLGELAERLDPQALVRAAEAEPELAQAQRLGYLLERIGRGDLARPLAEWIATRAPRVAALRRDRPMARAPRDPRWRVAVNEEIESS
jgi:predicted transcriptional regulator of viral defense system